MYSVLLPLFGTARAWRNSARLGLSSQVAPDDIIWHWNVDHTPVTQLPQKTGRAPRLPKTTLDLIDTAISHRDPARFDVAYRLLWQISSTSARASGGGASGILPPEADQLRRMQAAVNRCQADLQRRLRFHAIGHRGDQPIFGARCDPAHPVLERVAPNFAGRLKDVCWVIATPQLSVCGQSGVIAYSAEHSWPDWAEAAVGTLKEQAVRPPAKKPVAPPQPPLSLFPEPLPVQSRPGPLTSAKRRPAQVLHEAPLGAPRTSP